MMTEVTPPQHPQAIRNCALRLLARREHSRLELKRKLLLRNFPVDLIESTLDALSEKGWQNDLRYAQSYIRERIAKGDGVLKIQMKLRESGLSESIISETLPMDDDFWQEQLFRKWRKKCTLPVKDLATRAKDTRFLLSRGFTFEQINHFLKNTQMEENSVNHAIPEI